MKELLKRFKSWKPESQVLRIFGDERFSSAIAFVYKRRLRNRYAVSITERLLYCDWEPVGELIVYVDVRGLKKVERLFEQAVISMKGEYDQREEWWCLFDRQIAPGSPALTTNGAFATRRAFLRFVRPLQSEIHRSFRRTILKRPTLTAAEYDDIPNNYLI
jgi:hypothetical protein